MALVVFLRGINVGGRRNFRPSSLARELRKYDVVNLGAAGTFVIRKPPSRSKPRAEVLQRLPFKADVVICYGRDLVQVERDNPFGTARSELGEVRFLSTLSKAVRSRPGGGTMSVRHLYAGLCILGLSVPNLPLLPWLLAHGVNPGLFVHDLFANGVSSFFGLDVIFSALALIIFVLIEGARLRLRHRWLPIAATCLVGVSLGLPLFLYQRQAHLDRGAV